MLVNLSDGEREEISRAAKKRVEEKFSLDTLGGEMEDACREAVRFGDVQVQIGNKLIWIGGVLAGFSALSLGGTLWHAGAIG
jgi:alpha-1,3/alpha-1,6-mannosyltransferase